MLGEIACIPFILTRWFWIIAMSLVFWKIWKEVKEKYD